MSNLDKPKRQPGWSIPDAPLEIRRLAVSEAKRRGLKLHDFIGRAVLLALDHGGVLNDKYDKNALDDLNDKHVKHDKSDKNDKFDEVLARLAQIETVLNLSQPPPAETEASPPPVKTKPKRVRTKPQKAPEKPSDEA